MRTDSRLSRVLHVLLHMSRDDPPMTSERIAAMLGTHAAVVRRTLAGLRKAGYVRSEKGHRGGWSLACDLAQVSLYDIYQAVGIERLYAIGLDQNNPDCAVEHAVNAALADALADAEALLVKRLRAVTLAGLARDFGERMQAFPQGLDH
ncbi:Rrf2 family transcriptional regulator [Bordetella hinzii]|uniref:Rrf2 family transcriptional regulator n=1 Tax=Bordetella hinzii TaxID=103855 RepID=UPI002A18965C|nr:Rrf2 family transcriptional regulator [Bordetella hinzii]WPL81834.1 Rrf2 family transcriptional regulator [Bordetella hinzii]